jgi:hypothetical protein
LRHFLIEKSVDFSAKCTGMASQRVPYLWKIAAGMGLRRF